MSNVYARFSFMLCLLFIGELLVLYAVSKLANDAYPTPELFKLILALTFFTSVSYSIMHTGKQGGQQ